MSWATLKPWGRTAQRGGPAAPLVSGLTPPATGFLRGRLWSGETKVADSFPGPFEAGSRCAAASMIRPPTPPLRPVMTANTSLFRITATAGTKFVEAYFFGGIIISPDVRLDGPPQRHRLVYDPKAFFLCPPRIRLDQACAHCPKFLTAALGAGALFNSGVAVRSRKPAGDH